MNEIQKINSVLRTIAAEELEKAIACDLDIVDGDLNSLFGAEKEIVADERKDTTNNS